ncbi:MAG: hypothetical protein K2M19_08380 [Muribaculaceae bacterium]|nr:hypothetical protein [Muribaculaceae bacterium]
MAGLVSSAQSAPGTWKILPTTGTDITKVIDTPERVYYTTSTPSYGKQFLYCYDKEANETVYFTPGGLLSDANVRDFYYNPDGKYLLVTYTNGNIDLIYDSGRVVNLPEIKDSSLNTAKTINTVKFGKNNRIYIGTDFGLVVYDDQKHVVVESGVYNKSITRVLPVGNLLLIRNPETGFLCVSDINARHNSLDSFKPVQSIGIDDWETLDDNSFLNLQGGKIFKVKMIKNADGSYASSFENRASVPDTKTLIPTSTGWASVTSDKIYFIGKDCSLESTVSLPANLQGGLASGWQGSKKVWQSNYEGLGCFDLSGSTPSVISERYKPQGTIQLTTTHTASTPGRLYYHPETMSGFIPGAQNIFGTPVMLEAYDWQTGDIIKYYPEVELSGQLSNEAKSAAEQYGSKLLYSGASAILADPVVDGLIYVMTTWDGILGIKDGEIKFRFDSSNSPIETSVWRAYGNWLTFDNSGNLWLAEKNYYDAANHLPGAAPGTLHVLKKAALDRLRADLNAKITYDDWYVSSGMPNNFIGSLDSRFTILPSGKAIYLDGDYGGVVYGYDTRGTSDVKDDIVCQYTGWRDQDNQVSFPTYKTAAVADKNNHIWLGSSSGIYIIKDTEQLGQGSSKDLLVVRPKVARNDGTNYADHLLASETIFGIAVDVNNNKWIATSNSGLYQVNPDGTEILKHFTTDNSPLMSNLVHAVACNPEGNDVFIATPYGQYVYSSDAAPTAEDLSDVYAYPNPVRPDYEGWITITGLMDNTLVKITDTQGHAVYQATSEGGMIVWDGRDAGGNRVHSGVYLVFASTGSDQMSDKAVTKIVVIK